MKETGAVKVTTVGEIDDLLLAAARLLKDARLAELALENSNQVLGGWRAAHTAVRLSIEETKQALVPFLKRLDEARERE